MILPSQRTPWHCGPTLLKYLQSLSPGDMIVAADNPPEVADQFEARLLWLSEHAMAPGRQYLMQLACKDATTTVTAIKYREDGTTGVNG